jgi:small-conductance mechanosensitive channel
MNAQQDTSASIADTIKITDLVQADTSAQHVMRKLSEFAARESKKSIATFKEGRVAIKQDDLLEKIEVVSLEIKTYLKSGVDTASIATELEEIKQRLVIVGDGVFTNTGTTQTHRNLATSAEILHELLNRAEIRKSQADRYQRELVHFRDVIDSLVSDSVLYMFSSDTSAMMRYVQRLVVLAVDYRPADSTLRQATINVQILQSRINVLLNQLKFSLEQVDGYRLELALKTFDHETANIWGPITFERPMKEIIRFSTVKGKLSLGFYARNHQEKIFLLLLLIAASYAFLRSLKSRAADLKLLHKDFSEQLILRYPLSSAIVIVLTLFQFIFPAPPFIFNCILWIVSAIFLTIIFRGYITAYWMRVWLTMFLLFILACGDNLILQASRTERWWILFLALTGVVYGLIVLFRGHRKEMREKGFIYFIGFVVFLQLVSAVANLIGRYNLAKSLLTSGFFSVVIAVLFLWTVQLINEGLRLASEVYKKPEGKSFYIDFQRVGKKAPKIFYAFMIVAWFILFGRNFYAFHFLTDPFADFFLSKRKIGEYYFNISSVLVFVAILFLSTITSKIVSYFASNHHGPGSTAGADKKIGIGSWLLLIRIAIFSLGLFLAFAAAGVAMDKVALVFGALGVGIGFGLQALVNNLVSGLIIAFEKPVNVGDIIEMDGKEATMKSIGFRSSVVTTIDGADVVIPNGDLLNTHLVNWTAGSGKKRAELMIGVAYDTDLQKATELIFKVVQDNKSIHRYPAPLVLIRGLGSSSIDIQLTFWVWYVSHGKIKSEIISAINLAFKENNIVIPFPQQELHIRTETPGSEKKEKD